MPIIGICSGKGGVGKTTVSANLSAVLTEFGSVIVVDGDIILPNLHALFGLEPATTFTDVLLGKCKLIDAIYEIKLRNTYLDLLPSSTAEIEDANLNEIPKILRELNKRYDFVVVDIAAGLSKLALKPMMGCDEIYIVVNPEETSIMDARRVRIVVETLKKSFGGVIVNRYKGNKRAIVLAERNVGEIIGIIRESRIIKKCWEKGEIAVTKKPHAKVSEEFYVLAKNIIGRKVKIKPYGKIKYLLKL